MGSSRLPLILAVIVLAACGVGAWFVLRPTESLDPAVAGLPRPKEALVPQASEPQLHGLAPALPAAGEADARENVAEQHDHAGDEDQAFPLEGALWVDVRVVLPEGTPLDESVEVVAYSIEHEDVDLSEASISTGGNLAYYVEGHGQRAREFKARQDATGTCRVAFTAGAKQGLLELNANYAYLPKPEVVALPAGGPVTLEPRLGGRLIARIALPPSLPEDFVREELVETELQLQGWNPDGEDHRVGEQLGPRLTADLGGLRPGVMYTLEVDVPILADVQVAPISIGPGATLERHFDLTVGARLRGRVVDELGVPVAQADLLVDSQAERGFFGPSGPEHSKSADDGSFDLRGVPPGKLELRASAADHRDGESRELEVADLQVLEGLELVLPNGNQLAGRVTFPDGKPAAGAQVTLEEEVTETTQGRQRNIYRRPKGTQSDADGRFQFAGLGDGPYDLLAQHHTTSDTLAGERVHMHRTETWRARAQGVAPRSEVALVLEPPIAVSGRAVDDVGAPVKSFRVRVGDAGEQEAPWRVMGSSGEEIESEDGSFELRTLGRGQWNLSVEAEGYGASNAQVVTLPGDTGPFTFVLQRGTLLAGLVLTPDGRPAAGAQVQVSRSTGPQRWMNETSEHETDAEGRFKLEGVAPGAIELVASHDGFAPSATLALEARPAEALEDLELSLRVGGTLTGEVYQKDGKPDPGQQVTAQQAMGMGSSGSAQTDSGGRFTIEHLAPGRYQVMVMPQMDGMTNNGEEDPAAMLEKLRPNSAEIRDGEVTHVVLGAPPAAPVLLTGIVREAGRPMPDLVLMALAEGSSLLSSLKSARTAADGTFKVELPSAGEWLLLAGEDFDGEGSEFALEVPEVETHHVELDLPSGRISGRVVAPDGSPAAGEQVSLAGASAVSMFNTSGGREVQSAADGSFAFDRVRAGAYELRAGSDTASGFFNGSPTRYGVAILTGIDVEEGGSADGLELRLREPGKIVGRVRDASGAPVPRAAIWVRSASGQVLNPRSWCTSDAAGRFSFSAASQGRHSVLARTDVAASREVSVDVSAGGESEVELTLEAGTILVVAVEDQEGKALRARLRVFDEDDRDVSGLGSIQDMERAMAEGFSTREQRIGPLPPGRYRVEGVAEGGARAAKPVTLDGQPERKLRLRLKE